MLRAMISSRALVLFLVACGSSSNSGGGDKLTSIADTKTMGELTDVEKKQLCEDFKAFQKKMRPTDDEMLRMTCQAKAAMASMGDTASADDTALRASCKKELDACIAKKEAMQADFQKRYPGDEIFSDKADKEWSAAYRALRESPEAKEMEAGEKAFVAKLRPFYEDLTNEFFPAVMNW